MPYLGSPPRSMSDDEGENAQERTERPTDESGPRFIPWMQDRIAILDVLLVESKWREAIPVIREALTKAESWTELARWENFLYDRLGDCEARLGRPEAARAAYDKANECRARDQALRNQA